MRAASLSLRDFRCYEHAAASLGDELTLVLGPNGAGKTNLIEAIYVACTGRSFRTANDQEMIRFGTSLTRVELKVDDRGSEHELAVAISRGAPAQKRLTIDGSPVAGHLRQLTAPTRQRVLTPIASSWSKGFLHSGALTSISWSPRCGPHESRRAVVTTRPWLSATPASAGSERASSGARRCRVGTPSLPCSGWNSPQTALPQQVRFTTTSSISPDSSASPAWSTSAIGRRRR